MTRNLRKLYSAALNLGIDKVSQYKKDLKKQGHPVALVDAGDAIQGAPIGTLSNGESIVKIMNAVGFDFVIPGNHEFDYGMERFLKLASRQKCGYYSCNFVDRFSPWVGKRLDS